MTHAVAVIQTAVGEGTAASPEVEIAVVRVASSVAAREEIVDKVVTVAVIAVVVATRIVEITHHAEEHPRGHASFQRLQKAYG